MSQLQMCVSSIAIEEFSAEPLSIKAAMQRAIDVTILEACDATMPKLNIYQSSSPEVIVLLMHSYLSSLNACLRGVHQRTTSYLHVLCTVLL